jgi:hypothetical protein
MSYEAWRSDLKGNVVSGCKASKPVRDVVKYLTEVSKETGNEYGFFVCKNGDKATPHVVCTGDKSCVKQITPCPAGWETDQIFWHTHPKASSPALSPEDVIWAAMKKTGICAVATETKKAFCVEAPRRLSKEDARSLKSMDGAVERYVYEHAPSARDWSQAALDERGVKMQHMYDAEWVKVMKQFFDRRNLKYCEVRL